MRPGYRKGRGLRGGIEADMFSYVNPKRVTYDGSTVLYGGVPIYLQGWNWGKNAIYVPERDAREDVLFGMNSVRMPYRGWGEYGNDSPDGEMVGAPGHMDPGYRDIIIARQLYWSVKMGLVTLVGRDSNCGINCKTGEAACTLNGVPDQNYWSPGVEAVAKRAEATERHRYMARTFGRRGLIGIYEICIEPALQGAAVSFTQLQDLQEEWMDAILEEDPPAVFMLGSKAYSTGNLNSLYRGTWATKYPNKIFGTANLLEDAMLDDDTAFANRITSFVNLRTNRNIPVGVQQMAVDLANDPTGYYTNRGMTMARANGLHRWWWEKTTLFEKSGAYMQPSGQPRVITQPTWDRLHALFNS